MQSLGQAVYRHICKCSPDGGVRKIDLITEMASRGYHTEEGQVNVALDSNSSFIALRRGRFVKKIPYWRVEKQQSKTRLSLIHI